jgi:hypothetical protein
MEHRLVRGQGPVNQPVDPVLRRRGPARRANRGGEAVLSKDAGDRGGKGRGVVRGDQQAVRAVPHGVGDTAGAGRDDRSPHCHRLQQDAAALLVPGGEDDDVRVLEVPLNVGVR